jgi:hypothetical protein
LFFTYLRIQFDFENIETLFTLDGLVTGVYKGHVVGSVPFVRPITAEPGIRPGKAEGPEEVVVQVCKHRPARVVVLGLKGKDAKEHHPEDEMVAVEEHHTTPPVGPGEMDHPTVHLFDPDCLDQCPNGQMGIFGSAEVMTNIDAHK